MTTIIYSLLAAIENNGKRNRLIRNNQAVGPEIFQKRNPPTGPALFKPALVRGLLHNYIRNNNILRSLSN